MLGNVKFTAEEERGYNPKWRVVFNKSLGEDCTEWNENSNIKVYGRLTRLIDEIWERERMTLNDKKIRDKFMVYLRDKLKFVYPGGHLICSGSSISTCGTVSADMDLCYAVKTSEKPIGPYGLPIEKYCEEDVNRFMIDRINYSLRQFDEIKNIDSIDARVPICKFELDINDVDKSEKSKIFDFDINCNCVAGVYNAHLLGALASFDDRLPKLAIILKKWAKNVNVVNPKGRFNSYLIVLLIVHYLQCGVNPPVLPNLMKLLPEKFDGTTDPWNLQSELTVEDRRRLPEPENKMNVGALLCGFFRYYSKFDFKKCGISIIEASVIKMTKPSSFEGLLGSLIFVEEPYDGLTVPKNVKAASDFDHIRYEFIIGQYLLMRKKDGKLLKPDLTLLLSRKVPDYVATRESEAVEIIEEANGS